MIINELQFTPQQIKLKKHFVSNSIHITERNILLVQIKTSTGIIGKGEVAPLPGLSLESIDECIKSLNGLIIFVVNSSGACTIPDLFSKLYSSNMPCSVIFGIEQALFSILFKNKDYSIFSDFNPREIINVNAVIPFGKSDEIISIIESKVSLGYQTFKIKIGKNDFTDDLNLLELIHARFQNKIKIRLDANCAWDFEQAVEYINRLSKFNIEYIEQPVKRLDELVELAKSNIIPIAVDESINSISEAINILTNSPIEFLVIKPSIIGGIRETARIIKLANETNKQVIISSSFEGPIGKRMLVMLASLTNHNHAHGLDTMEYFPATIVNDIFPIKNGKINFHLNILSQTL